jgi:hypothetical protein
VKRRRFKAIRADRISKGGIITDQVIQQVVEAPLVIADLTDGNGNVFYELALRHAIQKPVILSCNRAQLGLTLLLWRGLNAEFDPSHDIRECRREFPRRKNAVTVAIHGALHE